MRNDCEPHHHTIDACRRQTLGEFEDQGVNNYKAVGRLPKYNLEVSSCKGPDGVRNHASGTQKEDNHVDYVRAIQTQKEDAHVKHHNGEFQAEVKLKQTMIDRTNNNQEVGGGISRAEGTVWMHTLGSRQESYAIGLQNE